MGRGTKHRLTLWLALVLALSGCTTVRQALGVPSPGDPCVAIKAAETCWLLIKNPRFGDVPSEPEYIWVEEDKIPFTFTGLINKNALIAPPEIVAKYGPPPGGGKISPRQGVPTQTSAPSPEPPRAASTAPAPARAAPPAAGGRDGAAAVPEMPRRGMVVYVDTNRIVIDLTAADGIRPGTLVSLRRDKVPIVHPLTGEVLGELDEEIGTARHTATLIHDDVVDQAPLRRGRPSANAQWGDDASLLVGDHLYSKSFAMLVRDNDRAVMETLARSTVSMTEAEVFQLELKRSGFTSEADYLRIITLKTASFMSACCRIGGLLGGLPPEQVEALAHYGLDIGVAFQISDDSLDFVADPERLGKAIGSDLREGKRTLPLIAMLDQLSPPEAERVRALLRRPSLIPAELEEIRRLVLEHDGVEYARAQAHAYAQAAKADLEVFPPSEERETLALVADFVVDRDR